ncbi:tripartite motif-containing protein 16-like [Hypomesus transpacificus]|uniref:tripartite motif-containing protein 16-like n=1 Tax=Hypomesus transpacificus TaxID=137520 RepID=UPI001F076334|nr:tripartite motif-containing protein 16-like [Hypomesus transpacificus]
MDTNPWKKEEISCLVCLNILTNPSTLSCGHNFCMECITKYWDQAVSTGICCCPCCRQTFTPRPTLKNNTMLEKMVVKLSKKVHHDCPPLPDHAADNTPVCAVCTGRKGKATKTCLDCQKSYCQSHLRTHQVRALLGTHTLVDAELGYQGKLCPRHNELLDVYCREERQCICQQCNEEEHQNHETVPVETERDRRQAQLTTVQDHSRCQLQDTKVLLGTLEEAVEAMKASAQAAEEDSDRTFSEMMSCLKQRQQEVRECIRSRTRALEDKAEQKQARLRLDIETLQRIDMELETSRNMQDTTLFLQTWQPISRLPKRDSSVVISEKATFDGVKTVISEYKELFDDISNDSLEIFTHTLGNVLILEPPVTMAKPQTKNLRRVDTQLLPKPPTPLPRSRSMRVIKPPVPPFILRSRADFLQNACQLTLDPNTAHTSLVLSHHNLKATAQPGKQWRRRSTKDCPMSFNHCEQVLCQEGLTGKKYYWEAEWTGKEVVMGVTYEGIQRKGKDEQCMLGRNEKSWSLTCSELYYSAWHNNEETRLMAEVSSPRIGVCLDHQAGTLTFYSISETITQLYKFYVREFTEPLYPGFGIGVKSSLKVCKLR